MSNCLVLQGKNFIAIGVDTASSVLIDGKYRRIGTDAKKLYRFGNEIMFCSGRMNLVELVTSNIVMKDNKIVLDRLTDFINSLNIQKTDTYDLEILICGVENNKSYMHQISQYNDFEVKTTTNNSNGCAVYSTGFNAKIMLDTAKKNYPLCQNISDLFTKSFADISSDEVGGYINMYLVQENQIIKCVDNQKVDDIKPISVSNDNIHFVIADCLIGDLIVGQTLKINNGKDTLTVDEDGLTITNGTTTINFNPNNTEIMNITNNDKQIFYVDSLGDLFIDGNIIGGSLHLQNDFGTYVDINPDKENIMEIAIDTSSEKTSYENMKWRRVTTGLNATYSSWTQGFSYSYTYERDNLAKDICQNQVGERNGEYYLIFKSSIKVFRNNEWQTLYDMSSDLSDLSSAESFIVKNDINDDNIYIFSVTIGTSSSLSGTGFCRLSKFNVINNTFTVMYKFDLSSCATTRGYPFIISNNRLYHMSRDTSTSKYMNYAWYCDIPFYDDDSNYNVSTLTVTMITDKTRSIYAINNMIYYNENWYAIAKNSISHELQLIKMSSLENRTGTLIKTLRTGLNDDANSPLYAGDSCYDIVSPIMLNNKLYVFWLGDYFSRYYASYWIYDFSNDSIDFITSSKVPSVPILDCKSRISYGNCVYYKRGIFTIVDDNKIHLFNETVKASNAFAYNSYALKEYGMTYPHYSNNSPTYLSVSEHYVLDEGYTYLKNKMFSSLESGKNFLSSQQKCFTSIGDKIYCINSLASLISGEFYYHWSSYGSYNYFRVLDTTNEENNWETLGTLTNSGSVRLMVRNLIQSNSKDKIYFHYSCNDSYDGGETSFYGVGYYDLTNNVFKYYDGSSFGDIWKLQNPVYSSTDAHSGSTSSYMNNAFTYYDEETNTLYRLYGNAFEKQEGFNGVNRVTVKPLSYTMISNIIWADDIIYYIASTGTNYSLYSITYDGTITKLTNVTDEVYSDDIGFSICLHYGKINILYAKHGILSSSRYIYYINSNTIIEEAGVFQDNGLYTVENCEFYDFNYKTCFVPQISTSSGIHIFIGYPQFTDYSVGSNGGYRHYLLKESQSSEYKDTKVFYVTKNGNACFTGDVVAKSLTLSEDATVEGAIKSTTGEIGGWTINDNSLSTDNITLLSDDYGQIRCKTDDFYALLYDGKYIFGVWDEANPYQTIDKKYVDISAKGIYARGSETSGYLLEVNNDNDTVTVYSTTDDKALSVVNFGTGNTLYLQNSESSYSNAAMRAYVVHDYTYEDDEGVEQTEKRSAYVSLFGEKENGRIVFRTDMDKGNAYNNSSIGTANFRWGSGYFGKLYTDSGSITDSDAKVKTIVNELDNELALTFINNLKPTEYYYNNSNNQRVHMGFIAQEVNKVAKDLDMGNMSIYEAVKVDETGREYYYSDEYDDEELKWSLNYNEFIAPLVGAVQALTKRVEDLEADNEKLRTRIEKLEDASE